MRFAFVCLALVTLSAASGFGQSTSTQAITPVSDSFSGRIIFHQKTGHVIYNVVINKGLVSGHQYLDFNAKPFADFVGGWYDSQQGRLSLLVQCTGENLDPRWRSQLQQFHLNLVTKEVRLEHMLYDYGATLETSSDTPPEHILDSIAADAGAGLPLQE